VVLPEIQGTKEANPTWDSALLAPNSGGDVEYRDTSAANSKPGPSVIYQPRWTRNIGHNLFEYARYAFMAGVVSVHLNVRILFRVPSL
jgi:hypothetical protein